MGTYPQVSHQHAEEGIWITGQMIWSLPEITNRVIVWIQNTVLLTCLSATAAYSAGVCKCLQGVSALTLVDSCVWMATTWSC